MKASRSPSDISLLGKIADFTEILDKDPQSKVFVQLADTYRRLGMLDEALEVAEKGVRALPGFTPGQVILGRICLERKDVKRAVAILEKAHANDPASLSAAQGLIQTLDRQGEKGRARQVLAEAIRLHPTDPLLRQFAASLGAPPHSSTVVTNEPAPAAASPEEDPIATPTIAEIYLRQGLPQRALKVYRDLLQTNPEDPGLRQKIREVETSLAAATGTADSPVVAAAATSLQPPPPVQPSRNDHLDLLERWLAVIRERKAHVR